MSLDLEAVSPGEPLVRPIPVPIRPAGVYRTSLRGASGPDDPAHVDRLNLDFPFRLASASEGSSTRWRHHRLVFRSRSIRSISNRRRDSGRKPPFLSILIFVAARHGSVEPLQCPYPTSSPGNSRYSDASRTLNRSRSRAARSRMSARWRFRGYGLDVGSHQRHPIDHDAVRDYRHQGQRGQPLTCHSSYHDDD